MGFRSFYLTFKDVIFFIYFTEQNSKEIIWLKRCYLLLKTRRSILKWYGSTIFLKQLNSSNDRLTPKTSVNVFCPAYWLIPLSQQNNKLNSPSIIDKPTTILNDYKKTWLFYSTASITKFLLKNIRQTLIEISCSSTVSKSHTYRHHLLTYRLVLFPQFGIV